MLLQIIINWFNYIKKPNNYIDKKIKKLNSKEKNLKKKYFLYFITFRK